MTDSLRKHGLALLAISSVALNAVVWAIAWLFPQHQTAAILHYTSSVGIDFVGEGRHIMVLPAVGGSILLINGVVGRLIKSADLRTAWVLWSAIPIVQLLLIVALLFLKSLNS